MGLWPGALGERGIKLGTRGVVYQLHHAELMEKICSLVFKPVLGLWCLWFYVREHLKAQQAMVRSGLN